MQIFPPSSTSRGNLLTLHLALVFRENAGGGPVADEDGGSFPLPRGSEYSFIRRRPREPQMSQGQHMEGSKCVVKVGYGPDFHGLGTVEIAHRASFCPFYPFSPPFISE